MSPGSLDAPLRRFHRRISMFIVPVSNKVVVPRHYRRPLYRYQGRRSSLTFTIFRNASRTSTNRISLPCPRRRDKISSARPPRSFPREETRDDVATRLATSVAGYHRETRDKRKRTKRWREKRGRRRMYESGKR